MFITINTDDNLLVRKEVAIDETLKLLKKKYYKFESLESGWFIVLQYSIVGVKKESMTKTATSHCKLGNEV